MDITQIKDKRVLYICGNLFPVNSGDAIYSLGIIKRLLRNRNVLHLIILQDFPNDCVEYQELLSSIGISIQKLRPVKNILATYKKLICIGSIKQIIINRREFNNKKPDDPDVAICDHLRCSTAFQSMLNSMGDAFPRVLISHNIEILNLNENIEFENSFFKKIVLRLLNWNLKKIERNSLQAADYVWSISKVDASNLNSLYYISPEKIFLCPVYFDYSRVKTEDELNCDTNNLLILGSMSWFPNVEGTIHFLDRIFPNLLTEDNNYILYIVGRKPSNRIVKFAGRNVKIIGQVDSVDSYIRLCDLLVVPNRLGGGVKIKIYEAIKKGIPIITYPQNTIGYNNDLFTAPFLVNNEFEFAESIKSVIHDTKVKLKFLRKGIALIDQEN